MECSVNTIKKLKTFMTGFMHFLPNCESVDFLVLVGLDARGREKDAL